MRGRSRTTVFLTGAIPSVVLNAIGCKNSNLPADPGPVTCPMTVSGWVINPENAPVGGIPVSIAGKTTVTRYAGRSLSVPDVTTPYNSIIDGTDDSAVRSRRPVNDASAV